MRTVIYINETEDINSTECKISGIVVRKLAQGFSVEKNRYGVCPSTILSFDELEKFLNIYLNE